MAKKFAKNTRDRRIGELIVNIRKHKFLTLWAEW